MLPFVSHIYPDQDFILHYGLIQAEYLFAMKTGTFPLNIVWHQVQNNSWAGVAGIFNPLFYITALVFTCSTATLLDCNILILMIMLVISHLALFRFLRKLHLSDTISVLLSTITVYSPRLLLSFSVGGAATIWPGYLLLCTAVGAYCLKPTPRKGPLLIIGLSYWLLSAGFAEEIYFSLLGAGLFTLFIPFFLASVLPDWQASTKTVIIFWTHTAVFCLLGALLAAAFILPFMLDSMKETGLILKDYSQAGVFSSTIPELISNFFDPLRSSPSGLLGGSPLLLMTLLIPLLSLWRIRIPRVIWTVWAMTGLVLICMLGDNTPVHYYVWKYFPLYSLTRYANRVSIILPMLFLLMLVWVFKQVSPRTLSLKPGKASPLSLTALLSLLVTVVYALLMLRPIETIAPSLTRLNLETIPAWTEPLLLITGLLVLTITAVYGIRADGATKTVVGLSLCFLTGLHLVVFYRNAPLVRKKLEPPDFRTYPKFLAEKRQHVDLFLGKYIHGFEKVLYPGYAVRQWEQVGPQPLLARIYEKYIVVDDPEEAYRILAGERRPDVLVVAGYREARNSGPERPSVRSGKPDRVRLVYNSYNRLVFDARAGRQSFFMFSGFRNGHWRAYVNGKPASTYAADGVLHAVRIPAGDNTVEFRYRSNAAVAGMLISCLTLAALTLFYGLFRVRGKPGIGAALAGLAVAGGIFGLWYDSLYSGNNLHTSYGWQAPQATAPGNLAWGKPTRASLPPFGPLRLNLVHGGGFAVDGGRSFASCFSTGTQSSPWLEIDLLRPEPVESIIIYTSLEGMEKNNIVWYTQDSVDIAQSYNFLVLEKKPVTFNLPPLSVSVSADHEHWETAPITKIPRGKPLVVRPEKTVLARYIRITAAKTCRLCLNEVEVYPPPSAPDCPIFEQ